MNLLKNILEIDKELFLYLNSFHSDFWDTIMLMVTRKETWVPFFAIIIFFVVRNSPKNALLVLLFLTILIVVTDQFSVILKESIQRLRPVHDPEIGPLVHNVLRKGGLHGFVSSHAANSFAIFAFTSRFFKNRWYSGLLLFWAVIFSYSRIYSGVHYPLDILGGAILGLIVGEALFRIYLYVLNLKFFTRFKNNDIKALTSVQVSVIFLVFAVLLVTVFVTSGILHHSNYL